MPRPFAAAAPAPDLRDHKQPPPRSVDSPDMPPRSTFAAAAQAASPRGGR